MMTLEDTEAHRYRRLWLDTAHELGQVAELLADALGWQPAHPAELPDAYALAELAAARLRGKDEGGRMKDEESPSLPSSLFVQRGQSPIPHNSSFKRARRQREYA